MLATHDYKTNPQSPVGNKLDVNEGDTLVYLMTNEENEHWWLAEDGKGQVGYVPATYLKIIRGWRKKKDVFSGSDRGIQEELGDLCGSLHS